MLEDEGEGGGVTVTRGNVRCGVSGGRSYMCANSFRGAKSHACAEGGGTNGEQTKTDQNDKFEIKMQQVVRIYRIFRIVNKNI